MLAEFFDALRKQAKQAVSPVVTAVPGVASRVLVTVGDHREWMEVDAPARSLDLTSLDSLIAFAQNQRLCPHPEVYLGEEAVRVVCDFDNRRGGAELKLNRSARWDAVTSLCFGQFKTTVPAARKFLRASLAAGDEVRTALGKIDFARKADGHYEEGHGRSSLGRAVEARVQGADNIPESFMVAVPVFSVPGLTHHVEVRIHVELHPKDEHIEFFVLRDDYTRAFAAALDVVRNKLIAVGFGTEAIPMFDGSMET